MGVPRTIGAVTVTSGTPTPVFTGTIIAAETFSITNGIATIVLGNANFPKNGYNPANGYPAPNATTGSKFDIAGPGAGSGSPAGGQQVTLWGFATATYFNGKVVSVINCDPVAGSFSFYFNHANVNSTSDAGNTAACPFQHYRAVRIECGQGNGTDIVYVGDLNVSSSRYVAALSLTGQLSVEIASENIPADRIFIDGTSSSDTVQVSLIY
jgi:hypothetical protein